MMKNIIIELLVLQASTINMQHEIHNQHLLKTVPSAVLNCCIDIQAILLDNKVISDEVNDFHLQARAVISMRRFHVTVQLSVYLLTGFVTVLKIAKTARMKLDVLRLKIRRVTERADN